MRSRLSAILCLAVTRRFQVESGQVEDLTPANYERPVGARVEVEDPHEGPVLVTTEYRIDPARTDDFLEVMQQTRRNRLRHGMLSWGLWRDPADPSRYVEHFVDESWVEHLRHFERMSAYDIALLEKRRSFHVGDSRPVVNRFIAQPLEK